MLRSADSALETVSFTNHATQRLAAILLPDHVAIPMLQLALTRDGTTAGDKYDEDGSVSAMFALVESLQ